MLVLVHVGPDLLHALSPLDGIERQQVIRAGGSTPKCVGEGNVVRRRARDRDTLRGQQAGQHQQPIRARAATTPRSRSQRAAGSRDNTCRMWRIPSVNVDDIAIARYAAGGNTRNSHCRRRDRSPPQSHQPHRKQQQQGNAALHGEGDRIEEPLPLRIHLPEHARVANTVPDDVGQPHEVGLGEQMGSCDPGQHACPRPIDPCRACRLRAGIRGCSTAACAPGVAA